MLAVMVCREFGWTWEQYQETPQAFIDNIVDMMTAEGRETEKRNKRAESKGRR